jgi:hypothetical protein
LPPGQVDNVREGGKKSPSILKIHYYAKDQSKNKATPSGVADFLLLFALFIYE